MIGGGFCGVVLPNPTCSDVVAIPSSLENICTLPDTAAVSNAKDLHCNLRTANNVGDGKNGFLNLHG